MEDVGVFFVFRGKFQFFGASRENHRANDFNGILAANFDLHGHLKSKGVRSMGALTMRIDDNTEIYYSEIHAALDEYIQNAQAEDENFDMRKAPQSRWNAALIYIYNNTFKGTNKLRLEPYDNSNNLNHGNMTNNNAYDIDLLNYIADYYISLCMEYDKEISIYGFSFLTGVSKDCIFGWAGNDGYADSYKARVSPSGKELYKKLHDYREESLSDMLISGKRNPVSILGPLNRFYGWNLPGVSHEKATQKQIGADDALKIAQDICSQLPDRQKAQDVVVDVDYDTT